MTLEAEELSCSRAVFTLTIKNHGPSWTAALSHYFIRSRRGPSKTIRVPWDGRIPSGTSTRRFTATFIPTQVATNEAHIVLSLTKPDGSTLTVSSRPVPHRGPRRCLAELRTYEANIADGMRLPIVGRWQVRGIQREGLDGQVTSQHTYSVRVADNGDMYRTYRREKPGEPATFEEGASSEGWLRQVGNNKVAMKWPPESAAVFQVNDRGSTHFTLTMHWTIKAPTAAELAGRPYPKPPPGDRHFLTQYEFRRAP